MPEVIVRKGEPVDRALKRLKNKLDAEGILEEVRRLRKENFEQHGGADARERQLVPGRSWAAW